jgi:formyltetrahydrofolate synthetase
LLLELLLGLGISVFFVGLWLRGVGLLLSTVSQSENQNAALALARDGAEGAPWMLKKNRGTCEKNKKQYEYYYSHNKNIKNKKGCVITVFYKTRQKKNSISLESMIDGPDE